MIRTTCRANDYASRTIFDQSRKTIISVSHIDTWLDVRVERGISFRQSRFIKRGEYGRACLSLASMSAPCDRVVCDRDRAHERLVRGPTRAPATEPYRLTHESFVFSNHSLKPFQFTPSKADGER